MTKFSIVMPVYLGQYEGCATNRSYKLQRAIESVIKQSFTDFELIIVCDGCEESFKIASNYNDDRISVYLIKKVPIWSGLQRNYGIQKAIGKYITYLDSDDRFGKNHLQIISDNINDYDWVYYNDYVVKGSSVHERECLPKIQHQSGTSNFTHKKSLEVKWEQAKYGFDDYYMALSLMNKSANFSKIKTPEYFVCHIPNTIDE